MLARARTTKSTVDGNGNRIGGLSGFWETILSFFMRSGPWAVLCLLLLLGIAYEAHVILGSVGAQVSEYVAVSGRNLQSLMDANEEAVKARIEMQVAMKDTSQHVSDNGTQILSNGQHILEMQKLMQDAYTLMKDGPEKREEQTQLLRRIEALLMELNQLVAETTPIPNENNGA